jgi:hypothetical protein
LSAGLGNVISGIQSGASSGVANISNAASGASSDLTSTLNSINSATQSALSNIMNKTQSAASSLGQIGLIPYYFTLSTINSLNRFIYSFPTRTKRLPNSSRFGKRTVLCLDILVGCFSNSDR